MGDTLEMLKLRNPLLYPLLAIALLPSALSFAADDDNQVRDAMIKESVRNFVGSCGCPFHYRNDGKLCGVKSAYDLSNGAMPLCYRIDISVEMLEEYRARKDRPTSAVVK